MFFFLFIGIEHIHFFLFSYGLLVSFTLFPYVSVSLAHMFPVFIGCCVWLIIFFSLCVFKPSVQFSSCLVSSRSGLVSVALDKNYIVCLMVIMN